MEILVAIVGAALVAGTGVWLVLRTHAATLQERLLAREGRIAELEARLGEELGEISRLQAELAQVQRQAATLETQLVEERKASAEKLGLLQEAQGQLSDAFKALSAEALKSNNESFLNLARVTLEKFQQGAQHDLEKRQTAIDQLVKPVRETLLKFEGKIGEIEKSRVEAYGSLTEQVKGLGEMQMNLRQETSNLVRALGSPRVRGRWGELQLRRVVEIAGMLEHCDFVEQAHVATEDGALRPDLIVRMPGGKSLVIDAKTPMDAYLQALEAPTEPERRAKLAEHARNIRDHMKLLGAKSYWKQFQPAPEFVVLFVPGESFFSAALEYEPELIDRQIDENHVIPASPTTLIALLRAAAYGWRQKALEENAQKISDLGRELYDRISVMNSHLAKLGGGLRRAVESYNDAIASFDRRVLVSARKFRELKATHEAQDIEPAEPVEVTPRALPESAEKENGAPKIESDSNLLDQK
jgi:DNA recombination protein RmuC